MNAPKALHTRRRDRGSVTLETVIVLPVVLTAVLLTINAALWYHARSIALSAAQEGVRTARAYGSSTDGTTTALTFAHDSGDDLLREPAADASGSTTTTAAIRVTGKAISLVPGLTLTVSQTARGPRERFTRPSGAPDAATTPGGTLPKRGG